MGVQGQTLSGIKEILAQLESAGLLLKEKDNFYCTTTKGLQFVQLIQGAKNLLSNSEAKTAYTVIAEHA
jgi:predicted transcriptional regulator